MSDTPAEVEDVFLNFLGDNPKSPRQIRTQMTKQLSQDPNSAKALTARAWALYQLDELDEAIADATKAIELCPKSYLPWHIRGGCYWQAGQPDKAEPDLSEAIRLADSVKLFLEDSYLFRGGLRCNAKRIKEALEDLNQCLKIHPGQSWGYVFRGNAYCHQQEYRRALKDFEKAIQLDKDDPYALAALSELLSTCVDPKIRDGKRALKLAQRACDLSDNDYLGELAVAYAELGDFKKAIQIQKRAIKKCHDPDEVPKMEGRLELFESAQPWHALWGD